jgi:hypothetical protein
MINGFYFIAVGFSQRQKQLIFTIDTIISFSKAVVAVKLSVDKVCKK